MAHILKTNIVGPDGQQRLAGDPVPASWGKAYIDSLVKSGGAKVAPTKATKKAGDS